MSPLGHEVFNFIQLDALLAIGCNIHAVVFGNYLNCYKNINKVEITQIPSKYIKTNKSPFHSRINDIKRLIWIKRNIILNHYDYIIFSSYDILSLCFFRFKHKILLINHNNVDQFNSKIKLYLTKKLPLNYEHIVLNEYMGSNLIDFLSNKVVKYIPHGFLEPSFKMRRPEIVIEGEKFIFCPVNRNYDKFLIENLIHSNIFNNYLEQNNITLLVKKQLIEYPKRNIKIVGILDDEEYNYMLSNALAVLLPYGEDFKYRCSGILFECVARNTPIIATPREALKIYENNIRIVFFEDDKSLIMSIKELQKQITAVYDKEKFQPIEYWKNVLKI